MKRAIAAMIAALTVCATGPLAAQAPDDLKARAEARRLAEEGRAALEKGAPQQALEILRRAEATYHAPTIVLLMAQARRDLGEHRAAIALYRRLLAEPIAADAPPAFRGAKEIAAIELREELAKVGLVEVVVRPAGAPATVTLAGEEAAGPGPYEVDPDVATPIRISAQGYEPVERAVSAARGARQRVEIELQPAGSTFERLSRSPAPVIAGLGLLGLGLAVGIPTGIAAGARKNDLLVRCPDKVCSADLRSSYESATLLADLSTASFVTAGLGAAVATVFLISSAGGRRWSTADLRVVPVVSPGFAGVRGSF